VKVDKIEHWAAVLCAIVSACALEMGCGPALRPHADTQETEEPELSKEEEQTEDCVNNLRQIDAAKEQWAIVHHKQDGDEIVRWDVDSYMKGGAPKCPAGGTYTYGKIGELPKCSVPGHILED